MSYLIMGHPKEALRMAKGPLKKWPHLVLDPVDMVPLAKLAALVTGDDYATVIAGFSRVTPDQPDVEPWDLDNLISPVFLVPDKCVRAFAEMEDDQLPALAKEWVAIPELKWYNFDLDDTAANLADYRRLAARCVKGKQSLLILIAN